MAVKNKVSKITLTTFNPKRIAAEKEEVRRLFLGTLIGRATGLVERNSPDQSQTYIGLGGMFEAKVTGAEPVSSGVLFIPETFQQELQDMLTDTLDPKSGEVITKAAASVMFSYRIFCVRANNAQGYSWEIESVLDPKMEVDIDPLAELRALVAPVEQPKIEDKSGGKKEKAA